MNDLPKYMEYIIYHNKLRQIQTQLSSSYHIEVLDGLRGFAVLYVIFDHLFPYHYFINDSIINKILLSFISMGWSGVDLFFVLSGFLITGILINTYNQKNYFVKFYGRRTLRIFPLYYAILVLCLKIIPNVDYFAQWNYFWLTTGKTTVWYWLYLYNFFINHVNTHSFLVVVWSLCIEEQYYVVFPSIVYFLKNKDNKLLLFLLGLIVFSFLLRLFLYNLNFVSVYHFTFTHLDGIALGGVLRILLQKLDTDSIFINLMLQNINKILVIIFCILILLTLYCTMFFDKKYTHICYQPLMIQLGYFIIPFFYTLLLFYCLISKNIIYKLFNSRFLRMTGKYSYAMYLFHFPCSWLLIILVTEINIHTAIDINSFLQRMKGMPFFLICIILTYLFAYISWILFEGPINNLKNRFL